jgi:ribosomal protein S18 acetylase RimI-like enzyme
MNRNKAFAIRSEVRQYPGLRRMVFLYALAGRELIGSLDLGDIQQQVPWIGSLWVRPRHRRRGVGRALMLAAIDRCRRMRRPSVTLWVERTNRKALAMYRSLGFIQASVRKSQMMVLGL